MLIDIFASLFLAAFLDPFIPGYGFYVIFGSLALFFFMWLRNIIRLGKNKSKGGMIAVILCGILCSFLIGWIVGMCISSDKDDTERERESKIKRKLWTKLKIIKQMEKQIKIHVENDFTLAWLFV